MPPAKRKPPVKPTKDGAAWVDEPLDFLRGDTFRQRRVCQTIDHFMTGEAPANEIIAACEYLSVDYPLHQFDVADDLVPLLRDRCKPSDNIMPVLEELAEAQKTVRSLAVKTVKALVGQLERRSEGGPSKALQRQTGELLTGLRRLSAIESGIILPLARVRLSEVDLADLSRRLKRRRGLADPS